MTFPAVTPVKKIDYVAVRTKELSLASVPVEVIDERMASDHRPVVAEISISAPADWLAGYGLSQDDLQGFVDTDGDSMADYFEWLAGTDPLDSSSAFDFQ